MLKKVIKSFILVTVISTMLTGCSNKEDDSANINMPSENNITDVDTSIETKNILEIINEDTVYENRTELKEESKKNIVKFSDWLNKYNIKNKISEYGYDVKNTEITYNKDGIDYNTIVCMSAVDSYKVNLIYENHIQEEYTSENPYIKLIYDIVKGYRDDLTIDQLAKELNDYASGNAEAISFSNDTVVIDITNKNTIKRLEMSFTNDIEDIVIESPVKEYSTMKEFIEDSNELANKIKEKSAKITENNMVEKSGEEVKSRAINNTYMAVNFEGDLYQEININLEVYRNSGSEVKFSDNTVEVVYSILEDVYGEDIKNYYSFEEFSQLVENNTTKDDLTSDNYELYNKLGHKKSKLGLPYAYEENSSIVMSNSIEDKSVAMDDVIFGNLPESSKQLIDSFDENILTNGFINIFIKIPVKAEGLTSYSPEYKGDQYVLDDGTTFGQIDTRY